MAQVSPLRRRMIEDMTVRNLSPATQRSYVHAVTKFSRFFGRSPDRLDLEDVRTFQVHLGAGGISWSALNQTVCALRFFYGVTLRRADVPERIPYARQPRRLPVVLSMDEVVRFLEAVPSLKSRTALTTAYATGLRASEVTGLKISDIDSGRKVIRAARQQGRQGPICDSCWASCGPIGAWRGRRAGCFPAARRTDRSIARCFMPPAGLPAPPRASTSTSRSTPCATASPPTCWRTAPISASSRRCLDTEARAALSKSGS